MTRSPLGQDFDAHAMFTFAPIPDRPAWQNRLARVRRWTNIALSQSWLAVFLYRYRARLIEADMRIVPDILDLVSRALFRVQIGRRVRIGPGLMIPHGNVVIDGETVIGVDCQINPWVTIGLSNSKRVGFSVRGPTIGDHVRIGTGAKILGPIIVGDYARIGANAVVVDDVPANATVVGMPARVLESEARTAPAAGVDQQLAARMRASIVEYKLHRRSLASLAKGLDEAFAAGTAVLRSVGARHADELRALAAAAEDGADPQVTAAIDEIDRSLRAVLEA